MVSVEAKENKCDTTKAYLFDPSEQTLPSVAPLSIDRHSSETYRCLMKYFNDS